MRLGGPYPGTASDPGAWVAWLHEAGYRAAYCPVGPEADDATIRAYREAAAKGDIVIAEVGAWSNPLSPEDAERKKALEKCQKALALADAIGARCCVNIAGSRGPKWDGPDPRDLTPETFDAVVQSVRLIIDAVKPSRTRYSLETMPWMYPDSTDSYERLLRAVDRRQFAVHFDPVNMVNSPERYFGNAGLVREFVAKLGRHIVSVHAKDTRLGDKLTVHLDEAVPGQGGLDYAALLTALDGLGPDLPVMLEHLSTAEDYAAAAAYVRKAAREAGVAL